MEIGICHQKWTNSRPMVQDRFLSTCCRDVLDRPMLSGNKAGKGEGVAPIAAKWCAAAMSFALIFPGQGSQKPGMGQALADAEPVAAEVFSEIDEALGESLSKTLWEGSVEDLTMTRVAQPGLMAVSLASFRALVSRLRSLPPSVRFFAGHSLGEYSALAAANSIELADAARLLRRRAEVMQMAVQPGEGAMAAIIGLEASLLETLADQASGGEICQIANDNGGGQIVISGHKRAVERAMILAKENGAKRTILLPVSAPFHSVLMEPAAVEMRRAFADTEIAPPRIPVVANVSARPHGEPDSIKASLVAQITGTVRWRESILWLADQGVDHFIEVGAGKVLTGLVKRIVPEAKAVSAGTPDELDALAEMLHE